MTKTNAIRTLDQKKIECEIVELKNAEGLSGVKVCLLYTSPSPRDFVLSRMPSSA